MNDTIDNDTGEVTTFEPMEVSGAIAAEISQQVATAKRYPRRSDKAISTEIMSRATLDEETAAECCYSLPRAGKDIVGPSVRFAELVFASYGNLRVGARFVELDTKDPLRSAIIVEGVCIDMQMNNGQTVPVRRSITGKRGVYNADMTNIAFSAGAAIARREAIIKTVPKSIWGAAWKAVLAVLQGDQKTLVARRKSSLEAFQKMGVEPDRVFGALDVAGEEAITLEHMPRLIGMWTSLRDGTETIDSLFGKGGPAHETLKNPLKDDPAKVSDTVADARTDNVRRAAAETKSDPISSGVSETIAKNADAATQGAQAAAATRQRARVVDPKIQSAATVIDANGRVTKSNMGEIETPIVDQRFEAGDQVFNNLDEWEAATAEMSEPEFLDQKEPEAASTDGGKSDMALEGSGKAAGAAGAEEGAKTAPAKETAQAKSTKPYTDGSSYMDFMRDEFDKARAKGSKTAVTEIWGSTRTERGELLSPEQLDELSKDKAATLTAIKLKEEK